jgi:hypothetical protein
LAPRSLPDAKAKHAPESLALQGLPQLPIGFGVIGVSAGPCMGSENMSRLLTSRFWPRFIYETFASFFAFCPLYARSLISQELNRDEFQLILFLYFTLSHAPHDSLFSIFHMLLTHVLVLSVNWRPAAGTGLIPPLEFKNRPLARPLVGQ